MKPWRFDDGLNAALSQVSADIDIAVPLHLDERLQSGWREELEVAWRAGARQMTFMYEWGPELTYRHDRIHARAGYRWIGAAHEYPSGPGPRMDTNVRIVQERDAAKDRSQDDALIELSLGEPFSIRERRFAVRHTPVRLSITQEVAHTEYPYVLSATLEGGTGPEATVTNQETMLRHTITAENRAVFLYLLARQIIRDTEEGLPRRERGWCYDEELITGIWGRTEPSLRVNNLSVLLSRTRGELRQIGFDPWFIERQKRHLRARVAQARIV